MSLCSKVQNGLLTSWDFVERGCVKVIQAHDWTGKKITLITNKYLPSCIASGIQKIYWSAPTMVPLLLLPRFYSDFFVKPIALMLPPKTIREEFGEEIAHGYYAGIRNACLIHAAVDAVGLAVTHNPWLAVPLIANLYMAAVAHLSANAQLSVKPA